MRLDNIEEASKDTPGRSFYYAMEPLRHMCLFLQWSLVCCNLHSLTFGYNYKLFSKFVFNFAAFLVLHYVGIFQVCVRRSPLWCCIYRVSNMLYACLLFLRSIYRTLNICCQMLELLHNLTYVTFSICLY
jgi:hypothetical protein